MTAHLPRERVLDLFAGAGAGATGFESRFDVTEAVDHCHDAVLSYRANHPGARVVEADVLDYWAGKHDFEGIRGVLATPPCQADSKENHRKRADDPRRALTGKVAELVSSIRPEWVVMENIPQVSPVERHRAEQAFRRQGYAVWSTVLNAADYGAAQRRKRWVLVAARPGRAPGLLPRSRPQTVREAFAGLPADYAPDSHPTPEAVELYTRITEPRWQRSGKREYADICRLAWDAPAPAITNIAKTYILHPEEQRTITVEEALVLFGLRASYRLHGNKRSRCQQLANAVPVQLAAALASAVAPEAA